VTWKFADDDIPAGHEGVVLSFLKDAGRVRVEFPNGTWNIKPHQLRVVEAAAPGPPSANGRTEQLCSYFQRGHCRNGERCQFVHGGEQLAAPIGEAVANAVFVCKLDWGATRAEVKSLFERAGAVKGVDFLPRGAGTDSRRGQCAVVHFKRAADASHAIATLDNATFVPSDTSSGRFERKVQVSAYRPRRNGMHAAGGEEAARPASPPAVAPAQKAAARAQAGVAAFEASGTFEARLGQLLAEVKIPSHGWTATKLDDNYRERFGAGEGWWEEAGHASASAAFKSAPAVLTKLPGSKSTRFVKSRAQLPPAPAPPAPAAPAAAPSTAATFEAEVGAILRSLGRSVPLSQLLATHAKHGRLAKPLGQADLGGQQKHCGLGAVVKSMSSLQLVSGPDPRWKEQTVLHVALAEWGGKAAGKASQAVHANGTPSSPPVHATPPARAAPPTAASPPPARRIPATSASAGAATPPPPAVPPSANTPDWLHEASTIQQNNISTMAAAVLGAASTSSSPLPSTLPEYVAGANGVSSLGVSNSVPPARPPPRPAGGEGLVQMMARISATLDIEEGNIPKTLRTANGLMNLTPAEGTPFPQQAAELIRVLGI